MATPRNTKEGAKAGGNKKELPQQSGGGFIEKLGMLNVDSFKLAIKVIPFPLFTLKSSK